jgi:hypothetical protein
MIGFQKEYISHKYLIIKSFYLESKELKRLTLDSEYPVDEYLIVLVQIQLSFSRVAIKSS